MAAKFMTAGEAERKRQQAIEFLERIGGDAGKFRAMDAAEYAESKGARLVTDNPQTRRESVMARDTGPTKGELSATLDEISDILTDADDAALTREEIIEKIRAAAELASGDSTDDDDEDDES